MNDDSVLGIITGVSALLFFAIWPVLMLAGLLTYLGVSGHASVLLASILVIGAFVIFKVRRT